MRNVQISYESDASGREVYSNRQSAVMWGRGLAKSLWLKKFNSQFLF